MNIDIVYHSTFGNTRQLAEVMADALKASGTVSLITALEVDTLDLQGVDLLLIGAPTHNRGLDPTMASLLETIPPEELKDLPVATFDTRYATSIWQSGSAAQMLAVRLQQAGAKLFLPPKSFFITDREGPLEEGECERAIQWTRQVMERFEALRAQSTAGGV